MESAKLSRKNEHKLSGLTLDVLTMAAIVVAVVELVWIYGWRG